MAANGTAQPSASSSAEENVVADRTALMSSPPGRVTETRLP
ncbi:hypothetical protein RAJCM14343_0417 [Rhodococcus aetherivorans]|uniref:Uncharacterized protein n=1 Tax=Rhodococcus aetherivorans TaxID=191292 RepID=A0ABQ0YF79_9NOCA|nr:hypothetical protein [Rhodococcus aetherivorans]MDV6296039.1 hypothetical protein [Rhodococcus aetherivorans]WFS12261.1 hypothetical protein P9K37_21125 [Rhodococcus aetherivorans]GES35170.1 hypothetical protein RAJCM14343_0417 [Rhodococcus aetherivorans]CCW10292.1 hypothetical protein EBESD8_8200 [Rhodococcus aetherivorans]